MLLEIVSKPMNWPEAFAVAVPVLALAAIVIAYCCYNRNDK